MRVSQRTAGRLALVAISGGAGTSAAVASANTSGTARRSARRAPGDQLPFSGARPASDPTDAYGIPTVLASSPLLSIVGLGYVRTLDALLGDNENAKYDVLISCVTDHDELDPTVRDALARRLAAAPGATPKYVNFPIFDRELPPQLTATISLVRSIHRARGEGARVLIGCGAGCGRSGMFAATTLIASGMRIEEAFGLVERERQLTLRPHLLVTEPIIEEPSQRAFIDLFARAWPVAQANDDLGALFAPMPLGVERVPGNELLEARNDLVAHGTYEAALVLLVTLAAADGSPRHQPALERVARRLGQPVVVKEPKVDLGIGRQPLPDETIDLLLRAFDPIWAEIVGTIDRSGNAVLPWSGATQSESASARADSATRGATAETATGPEGARASSDMARQPAPSSPAGATVRMGIRIDEKFEEYLAAEVAKLPDENRKDTVVRLSRLAFYGIASKFLYPEYEDAPTDISPPNDGYAKALFHAVDLDASEIISDRFIDANFDRFKYYRKLDL